MRLIIGPFIEDGKTKCGTIFFSLFFSIKEVKIKMSNKKEKYRLTITDSKGKEWFVSLKWLKQNLGLPDYTFYNKMFETEWKAKFNEKIIKFLRELHEPQTVAYFKHKILELIKDRTKQFYASTIYSKMEVYGLWDERTKAWDSLMDENVIVRGTGGYFKYNGSGGK